jgi:hypothetical protein
MTSGLELDDSTGEPASEQEPVNEPASEAPAPDPAVLPAELLERIASFLSLIDCNALKHINRHWRRALFPGGFLSSKLVRSLWDNTPISETTGLILRKFLTSLIERAEWDVLDRDITIYTLHLRALGQPYFAEHFNLTVVAREDDPRKLRWLFRKTSTAFKTYFSASAWTRVAARAFVAAAAAGSLKAADFLLVEFLEGLSESSYIECVTNAFEQAIVSDISVERRLVTLQWLLERTRIHEIWRKLNNEPGGPKKPPVDVAAREGELEIVKWLVEEGRFVILPSALEGAKRAGHLAVEQYLDSKI